MSQASFSLDELRLAAKVNLAGLSSLTASDGVSLAYRLYCPPSPRAAVLFYHGGGAHSGAGYQFLGSGLQSEYNMAVYLPDIRGHGTSGGPRGDAPDPRQVWADISTYIRFIKQEYPGLPLFVGGHSSGAGLTLNYVSQPDREPVDGWLFLSPQFGQHAGIDRPSQPALFATVDSAVFAAYTRSGGASQGHNYAVRFNYPAEVLRADPDLVAAITVTMSAALIPRSPREQFAGLDRPFGLWIGADDELFVPEKVLAFAELSAPYLRQKSEAASIPGGKHLSVLVAAHRTIGQWLERQLPA